MRDYSVDELIQELKSRYKDLSDYSDSEIENEFENRGLEAPSKELDDYSDSEIEAEYTSRWLSAMIVDGDALRNLANLYRLNKRVEFEEETRKLLCDLLGIVL